MDDGIVATRPGAVSETFAREWVERFTAGWNSHDPERLVGRPPAPRRDADARLEPGYEPMMW